MERNTTTIRIALADHNRLKRIAKRTGQKLGRIVRDAVRQYDRATTSAGSGQGNGARPADHGDGATSSVSDKISRSA